MTCELSSAPLVQDLTWPIEKHASNYKEVNMF